MTGGGIRNSTKPVKIFVSEQIGPSTKVIEDIAEHLDAEHVFFTTMPLHKFFKKL